MARRREALADVAAQAEVEHVLLYGANRAGSAVQWLTRWPVTREALVVTSPGQPDALFVQFFNHVPNAARMATEAEVRWGGPRTMLSAIAELRARGAGSATRVGLIGAVPFDLHGALSDAVGAVIDLNPAYTRLRTVKSAEEIDWIRSAAQLTDDSAVAVRDEARPGCSEHDLVSLVENSYLSRGGTNYIHYFSVTSMSEPQRCVPSQWPTARKLAAGDVLSFELSTSFGVDYPGQLLRTFAIAADPTPLYRDLHAVAEEALARIEGLVAPGVSAAAMVEAASVIEDAGFTTVDDLVHGLGGGYLPPVFGSRSRTLSPLPELVLAEGMTIVVQPNVTTPDGRAGVQTGELLLVTASGCERLHNFPRGLLRIA